MSIHFNGMTASLPFLMLDLFDMCIFVSYWIYAAQIQFLEKIHD